jgi:hypothetical protein
MKLLLFQVASRIIICVSAGGFCHAACPAGSHLGDIDNFALSPDATKVAALAEDGTLLWWDTATGKRTQLMDCAGPATMFENALVFSSDSSRLAVLVYDAIFIFELPGGDIVARLTGPELKNLRKIVFSGDGRRLAAGHEKGVTVWSVETQKELISIPERGTRMALAVNGDGSLVAYGDIMDIGLVNGADGKPVRTIHLPPPQFAEDLLFEEGKLVAALARANGRVTQHVQEFDREIGIFDTATGNRVRTLEGQAEAAPFPMTLTKSHMLFAFSFDGTMRSWDIQTGQLKTKFAVPPAYVSADGQFLLLHGRSLGTLALRRLMPSSTKELKSFVYESPVCNAGARTAPAGNQTEIPKFEMLFFADGPAHDGSMLGGRGYVTADCVRFNTTHAEFPTEEAARNELHEELKEMTVGIVEQGPRQVYGFVFGERALVRFPATEYEGEHVELLLTDHKHFYSISSSSLDLVLAPERKYYR